MKKFSCLLSEFVHERNTNISALSSETGIERTLLHKYISGTRTPSGISTVIQISEGLMLSDEEKNILCDSYQMASLGEEGYERNRITERIFRFLTSIPNPESMIQKIYSEPLISSSVTDSLSVELTIRRMISDSSSERIFVISPPSYRQVVSELINASLCRSCISVIQLLVFSPTDMCLNLKILEDILPLLVFCNDYTPLISYSMVNESVSLFPNIILTDKYAFCFSNTCDSGILHTRSDIIRIYHSEFTAAAKRSPGLILRKISSSPEISEKTYKLNNNLFIEKDDKKISLIFRTGSFWSCLLIYEQSIRRSVSIFLEQRQK